jgi:hypothetical protein
MCARIDEDLILEHNSAGDVLWDVFWGQAFAIRVIALQ